jgi:4,5-DOPA dioxygenase extradiol
MTPSTEEIEPDDDHKQPDVLPPVGTARRGLHKHLEQVLPLAREQPAWIPSDGPLPSLFVSHGAPFTLDDPQWIADLFRWAQSIPKPRAIVVVSAHWEKASVAISRTAAGTPLYYDFSGFHPRYKTLPYAGPDATTLAQRMVRTFPGRRQCTSSPSVVSITGPSSR